MKKTILFFATMFALLNTDAQFKYEVMGGKNTLLYDQLTSARNGFLQFDVVPGKKIAFMTDNLNKVKYGITVNKLDAGLNEISSKPLFDGDKKLVPWLYNIFQFNNKTYLLYHDLVDEEKAGTVTITEIDEETLTAGNEKVLIDYTSKGISFNSKKTIKERISTYQLALSENKKRLMLTAEPPYEKGDNKVMYVWVYDEHLKLIMERKIDFKTANENVNMYSTLCDNNGNGFFAYREYYGLDRKGRILDAQGNTSSKGEVQDDMKKLIVIKPTSNEITSTTFKLEGFSINNLGLVYSPKQQKVFMMGAFSEGWNENHLGVFHGTIDIGTGKPSALKITKFSPEFVAKIADDGYAKTKEKNFGLIRYFSPDFFLRGDGSVDVILKYIETQTSSRMDSRGMVTRTTTDYYGGDFIDCHLLDDNIRFARVGRDIVSPETTAYLLYTTFSKDDKLILIYNDNAKNIERDVEDGPKRGVVQKSDVCATTIDKDGHVTRQSLLPDYSGKNIGLLDRLFKTDSNSFLIIMERLTFMNMSTKDTKFIKITVN